MKFGFEILKGRFRCPFHTKAAKEGRLLNIKLPENRHKRMEILIQAFRDFYNKSEQFDALMITLPESLHTLCNSISEVKTHALRYRVEMLVAQLSVRLYPFLDWQIKEIDDMPDAVFEHTDLRCSSIAGNINDTIKSHARNELEFVEFLLEAFVANGKQIEVIKKDFGPNITVDINGCKFPHENEGFCARDKKFNKNAFVFFTLPFYPKAFGRYSSKIKIIVTRKADLLSLPEGVSYAIREWNTDVLLEQGVKITLPEIFDPGEGIWEPSYDEPNYNFKTTADTIDTKKIISFMERVHKSGITFF
jgi:hypothetical protein